MPSCYLILIKMGYTRLAITFSYPTSSSGIRHKILAVVPVKGQKTTFASYGVGHGIIAVLLSKVKKSENTLTMAQSEDHFCQLWC